MEIIITLFLIGLLFTGAIMYLLLCVDPNSKGLFGIMHRLLYVRLPTKIE